MTSNTTITTAYGRKLTVAHYTHEKNLHVKATGWTESEIYTSLTPAEATELATALLGENATVVTDLPEATVVESCYPHNREVVKHGRCSYYIDNDPEAIVAEAKSLLAIAAKITEHKAEQEAAKAAEAEKEAQRSKRRDEVTQELTGDPYARYSDRFAIVKKAIDRIVDLEEAAQVS